MVWRGHGNVLNLPKFFPSPHCIYVLLSVCTTLSASNLHCVLPGLLSQLPNWHPSPSLAPFHPTFQRFLTSTADHATHLLDSFQGPTACRTGSRLQAQPPELSAACAATTCAATTLGNEQFPRGSRSPLPTCFLCLESFPVVSEGPASFFKNLLPCHLLQEVSPELHQPSFFFTRCLGPEPRQVLAGSNARLGSAH